MLPEYIDIHSHLNFPQFDADRESVIARLREKHMLTITVGTNLETSKQAVFLAEKYEHLFATIGVHPDDDPKESFDEKEFEKLVSHKKVVAIGECGLDHARLPSVSTESEERKKQQKEIFELQIEFAVKHAKPLMIHCREAYPDTLDILSSKKREYGDKLKANFHFFTEPIETARKILGLDFTVSFTGVITFVTQYAEIVSYVPLEKMMSETDAPFVAPVPMRGKRNSPEYVEYIVKKISEIKKIPLEDTKQKLAKTAMLCYAFPHDKTQ
jgi:TatD DNase family protein